MSLVDSFDPLTSTNARQMCVWLRSRCDLVARFFADPTWAARVDAPATRDAFLEAIADVGTVLARLTELVETPPAMERMRAEIELELARADRGDLLAIDAQLRADADELAELHALIPHDVTVELDGRRL